MRTSLKVKDQHIIKLEWDFIEAQGVMEQAYVMGLDQAMEQVKYFFAG